ncbi:MAG: SDR family NAD(P)-dependent oxidoreductase [Chloroflexota bacterium]|jgi:NAD(P)-dependent dehydrogenase (short-subunit alcohol dehydrogenase family)
MSQKICVITGANSGIGKAAAIQIARKGYRVIMACRNRERGEVALVEVRSESGSDAVALMIVDMSSQASIRSFAEAFKSQYDALDVLIQNAAAFDVRSKTRHITEDGIESIWATNHLGPVLLTDLLLDALKRAEQGRVITISSKGLIAHPFLKVDLDDPEFERRKFSVQKAYYQSKLAQVMYTYWLADQLKDTPVTVNAIRVTNVRVDIDARYPDSPWLMKRLYAIKSRFAITPEQMAQTYTFLATSGEVRETTGEYFDDPSHQVKSSAYSRDPENIEKVMTLTRSYLKVPEGAGAG